MDRKGRSTVAALVSAALRLAPADRDALLADVRRSDPQLADAIEAALRDATVPSPAQPADTTLPIPPEAFIAGVKADRRAADSEATRTSRPAIEGQEFAGCSILRVISQGGQGIVFEAAQRATKRKVAIKVLRHGRFASPAARRRFEREIETVAQLSHPGIVLIHDAGETPDGQPYFIMDYISGEPLDRYVRKRGCTLPETLALFARVCDAVHYAHQRGVLHRDLKPSNILVDRSGQPRVVDFGLAKWVHAPGDLDLSSSRDMLGTLPYMAPEQARGANAEIDVRTDVYALGVTFYRILTGEFPYPAEGHLAEVIQNIIEHPAASPAKRWNPDSGVASTAKRSQSTRCPLGHELCTILLTALAKEPQRRYQSAGDLGQDLRSVIAGEAIIARRDNPAYCAQKWTRSWLRRHPIIGAALTCLLAALVLRFPIVYTVYAWTPLNDMYIRAAGQLLPSTCAAGLDRVRVIALRDDTDVLSLAQRANVDGVRRDQLRSYRRLHGALLERLANSGASAVAFDISFTQPSEHDAALVRGMRALHAANIPVVVSTPGWADRETGFPWLSPIMLPYTRWGSITGEFSPQRPWKLELALQRGRRDPERSLVLESYLAARHPNADASLGLIPDRHRLEIRYRRNPGQNPRVTRWMGKPETLAVSDIYIQREDQPEFNVYRDDMLARLFLTMPPDEILHAATIAYQKVFDAPDEQLHDWFAGRVVLVADIRSGVDRHELGDGRSLSGCYAHAVGLEALMRNTHLRESVSVNAWLLFAVCAAGVVLGLRPPRWRVLRWSLLIVASALTVAACLWLFASQMTIVNPLALVLGLWLAVALGAAQRRLAQRPT